MLNKDIIIYFAQINVAQNYHKESLKTIFAGQLFDHIGKEVVAQMFGLCNWICINIIWSLLWSPSRVVAVIEWDCFCWELDKTIK